MKKKVTNLLKFLIGWPLSVISLYFIIKLILNQTKKGITVHSISIPFLLYGVLAFLLYYLFRAIVWHEVLRKKGYELPFIETTYAWSISEVTRYVPGNIWSFVSRSVRFGEKNVTKTDVAHTLLIEASLILLSTILVSLFGLTFIIDHFFSWLPDRQFIEGLILVGSILGTAIYIFQEKLLPKKGSFTRFLRKILVLPFHPKDIANLVILNIISFFFFGLGYYFIAVSLVSLSPAYFLTLIGFFVFSLLVGLLSFITPTGLGVREGVITFGLQSLSSVGQAGFVAIISRIVLILTEVLFIGLAWCMERAKTIRKPLVSFWRAHMHEILLTVFILLFCAYFIPVTFLRHDNFYTGRFDLGNMDQTVWNTLHGRIFQFTNPNSTENISRLAFHADFILVLLAPFYALWTDPKMLLLIQSITLSCGAIFVYLLGKTVLKEKNISLLFSFLYLMYPAMQWVNLYDFHPVALATTFLLGTFYFWKTKRYGWFIVFAILSGLTKEQVWISIFFFGLAIFFIDKKRVLGSFVTLGAGAIFYFLIFKLIPGVLGAQHFALAYYSDFGDSPSSVIKNILFSPLKTIRTLLQPDRVFYLIQLFEPLAFLSAAGIIFLIFIAPDFAITLLSNNTQTYQIYYQYSSTLTPFIFISAIYGFAFTRKRIPFLSSYLLGLFVFVLSCVGIYKYGPLPFSKHPNIGMITHPQVNRELIEAKLSAIPRRFSVSASNNIGAHLSHRQQIYTVPAGIDKADIVALLLNDPGAQPSLAEQKKLAARLRHDENYILLYEKGDFIMFQKISTINKPRPTANTRFQLRFH